MNRRRNSSVLFGFGCRALIARCLRDWAVATLRFVEEAFVDPDIPRNTGDPFPASN